jgi:hypothetical protein
MSVSWIVRTNSVSGSSLFEIVFKGRGTTTFCIVQQLLTAKGKTYNKNNNNNLY